MNSRNSALAHTAALTVVSAIQDDVAVQLRMAHAEIMRERFEVAERTIESIASRCIARVQPMYSDAHWEREPLARNDSRTRLESMRAKGPRSQWR